jgi:hypothetical protein
MKYDEGFVFDFSAKLFEELKVRKPEVSSSLLGSFCLSTLS